MGTRTQPGSPPRLTPHTGPRSDTTGSGTLPTGAQDSQLIAQTYNGCHSGMTMSATRLDSSHTAPAPPQPVGVTDAQLDAAAATFDLLSVPGRLHLVWLLADRRTRRHHAGRAHRRHHPRRQPATRQAARRRSRHRSPRRAPPALPRRRPTHRLGHRADVQPHPPRRHPRPRPSQEPSTPPAAIHDQQRNPQRLADDRTAPAPTKRQRRVGEGALTDALRLARLAAAPHPRRRAPRRLPSPSYGVSGSSSASPTWTCWPASRHAGPAGGGI